MNMNEPEIIYETILLLRKYIERFLNKFFVKGVENSNFFPD